MATKIRTIVRKIHIMKIIIMIIIKSSTHSCSMNSLYLSFSHFLSLSLSLYLFLTHSLSIYLSIYLFLTLSLSLSRYPSLSTIDLGKSSRWHLYVYLFPSLSFFFLSLSLSLYLSLSPTDPNRYGSWEVL